MKLLLYIFFSCILTINIFSQSYTIPSGSNGGGQNIANVEFQGIHNNTGFLGFPHYNDYTAISNGISNAPGSSFVLTITIWNQYSGDRLYHRIWVDWNQNYIFDAGEGVYSYSNLTSSGPATYILTPTITIPANVTGWSGASNQYRMRIGLDYNIDMSSANSGSNFSEFEDYKINITGPLPVELKSFTVNMAKGKPILSWTTASEINNFGFEIERSGTDNNPHNSKWEMLGLVHGQGNSNSPKDYTFMDDKPLAALAQYRLKQINNDGTFKYYGPLQVQGTTVEFSLLQNYPNPFNPSTEIKFTLPFEGDVKLMVYNILGKVVKELIDKSMLAGYHETIFNADELSSGIYFYSLALSSNDGKGKYSFVRKMILLR